MAGSERGQEQRIGGHGSGGGSRFTQQGAYLGNAGWYPSINLCFYFESSEEHEQTCIEPATPVYSDRALSEPLLKAGYWLDTGAVVEASLTRRKTHHEPTRSMGT